MKRSAVLEVDKATRLPLLREEFKDGPPSPPPHSSKRNRPRSRISWTQKLFVLYRYSQGYSARRIALELGISDSSAKRILKAAHEDPEEFVFTGWVVHTYRGKEACWTCRYCGWLAPNKASAAHHGFGEVWDEDELRVAPRGYL